MIPTFNEVRINQWNGAGIKLPEWGDVTYFKRLLQFDDFFFRIDARYKY